MQESAADVDRVDRDRTPAQQDVRETAGRRADVRTHPSARIDAESIEGGSKLEGAAARVARRRVDCDVRVFAHLASRTAHRFTGHTHLAREDQSLRTLA